MLDFGRIFVAPVVGWRAKRIADPIERLRFLRRNAPAVRQPGKQNPQTYLWMAAGILTLALALGASYTVVLPPAPHAVNAAPIRTPIADVWLVESKPAFETYSNGLRIETGQTVDNGKRHGVVFDANNPDRTFPLKEPVGIVYHTTESDMAPFKQENSGELRHLGESLLRYIARKQAYHYVIDRFGAVHRMVAESSPANHAGHSLWADQQRLYVNLNESFIGVSFETQTAPGDDLPQAITPAQVHSARVLTEMLRARYHIATENCVTHAQISINPENKRIGHHTDWASNFPFAGMGLPDNYELPVAAIERFGFSYDSDFIRATGSRVWRGLLLTEQRLDMEAARTGKNPANIRAERNALYERLVTVVRNESKDWILNGSKERSDEQGKHSH